MRGKVKQNLIKADSEGRLAYSRGQHLESCPYSTDMDHVDFYKSSYAKHITWVDAYYQAKYAEAAILNNYVFP